MQATAKPKGLPQKHSWNPSEVYSTTNVQACVLLASRATQRSLPVSKPRAVGSAACRGPSYDPQAGPQKQHTRVARGRSKVDRLPLSSVKRRKGRRGPTSSSTAGQCLRYVAPVLKGDAENLTEQKRLAETSSAATAFGSAVTVILQRIGARACSVPPQRHFDHGVGMPLLCRRTTLCPIQNQHVLKEKC